MSKKIVNTLLNEYHFMGTIFNIQLTTLNPYISIDWPKILMNKDILNINDSNHIGTAYIIMLEHKKNIIKKIVSVILSVYCKPQSLSPFIIFIYFLHYKEKYFVHFKFCHITLSMSIA